MKIEKGKTYLDRQSYIHKCLGRRDDGRFIMECINHTWRMPKAYLSYVCENGKQSSKDEYESCSDMVAEIHREETNREESK